MGTSGDHEVESRLIISGHDAAPRVARRFARETAAAALYRDAVETLELLVSELVTAAMGDRDAVLEVSVAVRSDLVRVELLDASVRTPPPPAITTEIDRFRAAILARLADGTGAHMTEDGCRHWLELRRRPRARR
jgi:hypothetical protein